MAILKIRDNNGNVTEIPAIKGSDGKSAYKYAQDGGYTGTEKEFEEKLAKTPVIKTTTEITPMEVKALMDAGESFAISHTDSNYGAMLFNSFVFSQAVGILSTTVFETGGVKFCAQLAGKLSIDKWMFSAFTIAGTEDIPTELPNPSALTIGGTTYNGSEAVDITGTIDGMIDTKLDNIKAYIEEVILGGEW
jgi:hypothetical protein